jgi:elongation factor G
LVFKVVNDSYVGRLAFVRVYSGKLRRGQNIYNPRTRKRERLSRLLRLRADDREDVDALYSGEIGAVAGLKDGTTGDTLCMENAAVELERIAFPEPVMFMAIEPRSRADRDKLQDALSAMASEDPTYTVRVHPETGQTIMSGMGELHLDIVKDRIRREFNVEANTGKPMVAYHETVTGEGRGEHRFDREIGGKRQFGHVVLDVAALPRSAGNKVELAVRRDAIPTEFHESVSEGVTDGLVTGVLGRYPMTDVRVRVTGGSADTDASTDTAFRTAARVAFREAVLAAGAELLEPIMTLDIVTPDENMGDVLSDLNGRRGKILEMSARGTTQFIRAAVPLAELFGYSTTIRSLSRGHASYTLEPREFDIVPPAMKEALLSR